MKTLNFSKRIAVTAVLCLITAVGPARANPDQRSDRQRIQSVIIGKYVSEMDLTPEQSERFFPRLRQYQDQLESIQRGERNTRVELDQLSRTPGANGDRLQGLLGERRRLDNEASVLKLDFLGEISKFLTPQQVSRCSILLDEIPQKMKQFMREKEREKSPPRRGAQQQPRSRGF